MLSRNASPTHATVPDGFYFEDIVFLDDLFKTGKKGIQGFKQIAGLSILNHFGESDEVCEENGYCRIILTLDLLAAFIKFFILPDHGSSCIPPRASQPLGLKADGDLLFADEKVFSVKDPKHIWFPRNTLGNSSREPLHKI